MYCDLQLINKQKSVSGIVVNLKVAVTIWTLFLSSLM